MHILRNSYDDPDKKGANALYLENYGKTPMSVPTGMPNYRRNAFEWFVKRHPVKAGALLMLLILLPYPLAVVIHHFCK